MIAVVQSLQIINDRRWEMRESELNASWPSINILIFSARHQLQIASDWKGDCLRLVVGLEQKWLQPNVNSRPFHFRSTSNESSNRNQWDEQYAK